MRLLINGESGAIQVPVLSQMSANESASMNLLARWWKRPKKGQEKQNLSKTLNGTSGHLYLYLLTSFRPPGCMSHGPWPVSPLNHTYGQTQTPLCHLPFSSSSSSKSWSGFLCYQRIGEWSNNLAPNPESRPISSPLAASSSSWYSSVLSITINHHSDWFSISGAKHDETEGKVRKLTKKMFHFHFVFSSRVPHWMLEWLV